MPLEDHFDLRDPAVSPDAPLSDAARLIRSERAASIMKDIARALGIPPAAFFSGPVEMRDLALADLCRAVDRSAGRPIGSEFARSLDRLRHETDVVENPEPEPPKLAS